MLRISKLADYGTVIMNCLARSPETLFSANEVAQLVHLTLPTTSKVLKRLVVANLINSVRGASGGYRLARDPAQISVADVIAALDGQPALTQCSTLTKRCSFDAVCGIRDNWRLINTAIMRTLHHFTLADMVRPLDQHPLILNRCHH